MSDLRCQTPPRGEFGQRTVAPDGPRQGRPSRWPVALLIVVMIGAVYALGGMPVVDAASAVAVSETTLTVPEGASATYTVKLTVQPTSSVVISVTTSGSSDVTVSPLSLTFDTSNWSTAQTVTVSAAQDDDAVDNSASVAHAVVAANSAAEYDAVTIAGVVVTIDDDDIAGVDVHSEITGMLEGSGALYKVRLNAQPTSDVVISVTKSGSSSLTVSPATLTFTRDNWNIGGTVRVQSARDADAVDDTATIAHAIVAAESADEYDAVTIGAMVVTVDDSDTAEVTVSVDALSVNEGRSSTYTLRLTTPPSSSVVISVSTSDNTDVTVSPATLTITRDNWNTPQTVMVLAARDEDTVPDQATITHEVDAATSADEYDGVTVGSVMVRVVDTSAAITVSASTLSVTEGGKATYTVKLAALPTANVVIGVTRSDGSTDVTVSPASLTFTPDNWNTAQTVTVQAAQDPDAATDTATITIAVLMAQSPIQYVRGVPAREVDVIVTEDDTGATLSPSSLTVNEGSSGAYTVKLNGAPSADVVIGVTRTSGSTDVMVSPASLTFTPHNWNTAQAVTVRVAKDDNAENEMATLSHAAPPPVVIADLAVTVIDSGISEDDQRPPVRSPPVRSPPVQSPTFASLTVDDQDFVVGAGIGMLSLPSALQGDGALTYSLSPDLPAGLRFNSNLRISGTPTGTFPKTEFTLTATDANGNAGQLHFFITVNNRPGVSLSQVEVTLAEGGSATYMVVLDAQPASDVVIAVRSNNTDVTLSPTKLTFTDSNWSTAQTVTVAAAQDADAVNDAVSISHAVVAAESADEFDAATIAGVAVSVSDDDSAGVTVSASTLTVAEGGSATYTLVLDAQPASDVVISVTRSGSADVTLDTDTGTSGNQDTLTFTTSNWSEAQTVPVSAAQDDDTQDDAATITQTVVAADSADEYDAVSIATVAVSVIDNDEPTAELRISAQRLADGYTEFALQQRGADGAWGVRILPTLRFVRASVTAGRWQNSSALTIQTAPDSTDANLEVRISARRLADGRMEFSLQQRNADGTWGERLLPTLRFVAANPTQASWQSSSPLTVTRPAP